jgi:hypothetical protein
MAVAARTMSTTSMPWTKLIRATAGPDGTKSYTEGEQMECGQQPTDRHGFVPGKLYTNLNSIEAHGLLDTGRRQKCHR